MKRTAIYIAMVLSLVLAGQLPFRAGDVGSLRPVEALMVGPGFTLRTDTGDMGRGSTWAEAFQDLENRAPGTIFQGTVSFLLLDRAVLPRLSEILAGDELNPGCGVCLCGPEVDLTQAAEFLRSHEPRLNLRLLRAGDLGLQTLSIKEGGLVLEEP